MSHQARLTEALENVACFVSENETEILAALLASGVRSNAEVAGDLLRLMTAWRKASNDLASFGKTEYWGLVTPEPLPTRRRPFSALSVGDVFCFPNEAGVFVKVAVNLYADRDGGTPLYVYPEVEVEAMGDETQ
jgi:hypothetical protein